MEKNIVIIGMPGSGKTTIGILLSKKLKMNFIDMDDYLEQFENRTIKEMFAIGEEYFRDVETRCSSILGKLNSHVIATGGGIVKRKENMIYLQENSIIIFLNRQMHDIFNDIEADKRPLLATGKEKLYQLYDERINLYKKYGNIEISNSKTIDDAVELIIKKVKEYNN